MKKHDSPLPLLFVVLLACMAATMPLVGPGCAHPTALEAGSVFGADVLLYQVEKEVPAAFHVVDAFLLFEHAQHATLPEGVRTAAAEIRAKAPDVFTTMNTARDEYVAAKAAVAAVRDEAARTAAELQLSASTAALNEKLALATWALQMAKPWVAKYAVKVGGAP
jgi:hypothetical protein